MRLFEIPYGPFIDLDKVESVSVLKRVSPNIFDSDTVLGYEIIMVSGRNYLIEESNYSHVNFLKVWVGEK